MSYLSRIAGRGAAMIIESLRLFYHLRCFKCCVCHVQLGNGSAGTDVRVRNNKLHCQNCYSNDEGILRDKIKCTVGFINCFLIVPEVTCHAAFCHVFKACLGTLRKKLCAISKYKVFCHSVGRHV